MGLERKGTQFRIRVTPPSRFRKRSFVTLDPGRKGGLQFVRAIRKRRRMLAKNLETQSIRVSTRDFKRVGSKLIPKTGRGKREAASLKRTKTGRTGVAIKIYF